VEIAIPFVQHFFGEVFFSVSFAEDRKDGAITSGRWLDDVRDKALLGIGIEIFKGFTRAFLMFGEIVSSAVCDSFKLLDSKWEFVFDIVSFFRIVGTFTIGHIEDM